VCTTELIAFAKRHEEFERRGVKLLGSSVDSHFSHIAWVRNIEERFGVRIQFPIIADLDQKVANLYGMIHEPSAKTAAVRCVFFVDPKMTLRAMIYYPLNVGRNFDEILRVIDALQTTDRHGIACPADWKPGNPVIVPPPVTIGEAEARSRDPNLEVTEWYFSEKRL
jgi:peroxiredoxin (alkyl hydroperoxide reductase subunit C)